MYMNNSLSVYGQSLIQGLISQLKTDDKRAREFVSKAIVEIGSPAKQCIEKELYCTDSSYRAVFEAILDKIYESERNQ